MPRQPRLDAPGVLHHVMARGIERRPLFRTDTDRDDFVERVAGLATTAAWTVYAWALLPNHFHLLVRTAQQPLSRSMRSLLTGYAGMFNRRHRRSGHLLQNRYKSIVCEEEPYLLELVRYLYLNPLRAGIIKDVAGLARYPYSGHAVLMGTRVGKWQDTDTVLAQFAPSLRRARARYEAFVTEGVERGQRRELQGGGLVRSVGGWAAVRELRRGRESYASDERVLGSTEFVEQMKKESERANPLLQPQSRKLPLATVLARVCKVSGVPSEAVSGGGRRPEISRVREGVAYLWVEWLGHSGRQLGQSLGIRPESVYKAARRGRQQATYWQTILTS